MRPFFVHCPVAIAAGLLVGCVTDAATRLAYDLEAAVGRLGREDGATYTLRHRVPSKSGECVGPYRVQLDKVGAIIIWCKDAFGDKTVSSHSTSYHRRFVVTPETHILDKPASEALIIELQRRGGQAVVASVQ
jgi:hypothetical protein